MLRQNWLSPWPLVPLQASCIGSSKKSCVGVGPNLGSDIIISPAFMLGVEHLGEKYVYMVADGTKGG
jgi:hypothetical protein